jgi:hypothetical protein
MATNDFLLFGGAVGANVMTQAAYSALLARTTGFSSGTANSAQLNKVWRQASIMSAALAQMIVDNTGLDVLDDGTITTILASLKSAVKGRFINIQVFTSSGTYTPTAGTTNILVEVQGGGGGGGGAATTAAAQAAAGSGGSAGAFCKSKLLTSAITFPVTITVGSAGAGGAAGNNGGIAGSASSFGALLISGGGPGGAGSSAVSTTTTGSNVPPGRSSLPTLGNLANYTGMSGGYGLLSGTPCSGFGGSTIYGGGGSPSQGAIGNIGTGYGAGGGGGSLIPSSAAVAGGNGAPGVVIVWEYA